MARDMGQHQKDRLPHKMVSMLLGTSECLEDPEEALTKGSSQENQLVVRKGSVKWAFLC